jgi:hypothetical protein
MKTSRRRSDNVLNMPVDAAGPSTPAVASDEEIARRAYDLYCARGCEDGRDFDDWVEAERQLRGERITSVA